MTSFLLTNTRPCCGTHNGFVWVSCSNKHREHPTFGHWGVQAALDICKIRPLKVKELEEQFNLSHGTIWDIVHECLGYGKVYSRWVPRQRTTRKTVREHPSLISSALMIMVRISWSKSLLGMKLGCTSTVLRQKRNPWHRSIQGLPPSKSSRHQPALGN